MVAKHSEEEIAARFWERVDKGDFCWKWIGSHNAQGYGTLYVALGDRKSKTVSAHRLSWKICRGEIPENLCVCHNCDVRDCVNPDHLFIGTQRDNMIDCSRKLRSAMHVHPDSNGNMRLTRDEVIQLRTLYATGEYMQHELAVMFGVTQVCVSQIILRKTWKHVSDVEPAYDVHDNYLEMRKNDAEHPPHRNLKFIRRGSRNVTSKLTEAQVASILSRIDEHTLSPKQAAREYGVHPRTIRDILERKTWRHVRPVPSARP